MTPAEASERERVMAVLSTMATVLRDDIMREIAASDAARQATEDHRSVRRNRNRLYVLVCGILCSLFWPALMAMTTHSVWLASLSATAAFVGDLSVTAYALWRRI